MKWRVYSTWSGKTMGIFDNKKDALDFIKELLQKHPTGRYGYHKVNRDYVDD